MSFIAFALLPLVMISFVMSGWLIGKWTVIDEYKTTAESYGAFLGLIAAFIAVMVAVALGTNGPNSNVPANIPAMLGLCIGCILIFPILGLAHLIKIKIDVQKTIDKKLDELLRKRKLENDIILKNAGIL